MLYTLKHGSNVSLGAIHPSNVYQNRCHTCGHIQRHMLVLCIVARPTRMGTALVSPTCGHVGFIYILATPTGTGTTLGIIDMCTCWCLNPLYLYAWTHLGVLHMEITLRDLMIVKMLLSLLHWSIIALPARHPNIPLSHSLMLFIVLTKSCYSLTTKQGQLPSKVARRINCSSLWFDSVGN